MRTLTTIQTLITMYLLVLYALLRYCKADTPLEFYVGKNGTIVNNSCTNWLNPCGSLYSVSKIINSFTNMSKETPINIHVIDGQNEADIMYHINMGVKFNPCFAIFNISEVADDVSILTHNKFSIIFNTTTIKEFTDWFPPVCNTITTYTNTFMFESTEDLSIYNLFINDYLFKNIGIIKIRSYYNLGVNLFNSKFSNLTFIFDVNYPLGHDCMIFTACSMNITDTQFIDIQTNGYIIVSINRADGAVGGGHVRALYFKRSSFTNITIEKSFLRIAENNLGARDVTYAYLRIYECVFDQITAQYYVINDELTGAKYNGRGIVMSDSIIILSRSHASPFYYSKHQQGSYIFFENVTIVAEHISSSNQQAIFTFAYTDEVQMNSINIFYSYDISKFCDVDEISESGSNTYSDKSHNVSAVHTKCDSVILINNFGQMKMNDINVDIVTVNAETGNAYYWSDYEYALFVNKYILEMNNVVVKGTVSTALIRNDGELNITNSSFQQFHTIFDPYIWGSLQAIWTTVNEMSTIIIQNSSFTGFDTAIVCFGGSLEISNSIIENNGAAMYLAHMNYFNITNNKIVNNGPFNLGSVVGNCQRESCSYIIYIYKCMNIFDPTYSNPKTSQGIGYFIENNYFSGYNPLPLIRVLYSSKVNIIGNIFNINPNNLFWNVSVQDIGFTHTDDYAGRGATAIYLFKSHKIQMIGNTFFGTNISLYDNPFIVCQVCNICMTGNTFNNYAFHITGWSFVTSCFRPQLVDFVLDHWKINNNSIANLSTSQNQIYGNINASLLGLYNTFIIDNPNTSHIWRTGPTYSGHKHCFIAMDNVNITVNYKYNTMDNNVNNNDFHPILFDMYHTTLLLIDSYITNYDISYDNKNACQLISNQRLTNEPQYVSSLLINCCVAYWDMRLKDYKQIPEMDKIYPGIHYNCSQQNSHLINTMESNLTVFTNHLTPTKIRLFTRSEWYYPGERLKFDFIITDILNNKIESDEMSKYFNNYDKIMITLQFDTFSAILSIESGNICPLCDSGLILFDVSMNDIGNKYPIHVSMDQNVLVVYQDNISINIYACPISFEPDFNNYVCQQCNTDYYNLLPNNTEKCKSCDPQRNEGIKCFERDIQIKTNVWMSEMYYKKERFLISSTCPPGKCCINNEYCSYFNDKHQLCAENRNSSTYLCSSCNIGYSEAFGSTKCIICKENNFEYLLIPFVAAVFYMLFLTHFNLVTETNFDTNKSELNYVKLFTKDDMEAIKIAILRPIVYLFQAVSIVTIQHGYAFYLQPLLDMFSMQFVMSVNNTSSNTDGICLQKNLTPFGKDLFYLFFPASMLLLIFIYYIFYTKLISYKFKTFTPNFLSSFWHTTLIAIGTILGRIFNILACRTLGNDEFSITIHFYGNSNCYGRAWMLAFISLIVVIVFWICVWYKLYKMDASQRNEIKCITRNLTQSYKEKYWYWEFIYITRRILLTFVITFNYYLSQAFTQFILLCILIFCCWCWIWSCWCWLWSFWCWIW
eukprot:187779_1